MFAMEFRFLNQTSLWTENFLIHFVQLQLLTGISLGNAKHLHYTLEKETETFWDNCDNLSRISVAFRSKNNFFLLDICFISGLWSVMLQLLLPEEFFYSIYSLGRRRNLFWLLKLFASDSALNLPLENN